MFVSSLRTVTEENVAVVDVFRNASRDAGAALGRCLQNGAVLPAASAGGRTADVRARSPLGKSSSVYKYRPVNRRCAVVVVALVPLVFLYRRRTVAGGKPEGSTRYLRRLQITHLLLGESGLNRDPTVRDNSTRYKRII